VLLAIHHNKMLEIDIKTRLNTCIYRVNELIKKKNIVINYTNVLHSDEVIRVKKSLHKKACYVYRFYHVPSNYYEQSLLQRRDLLNASDVNQLCKSIIFENTACSHSNTDDPTDSRFYAVIVQYASRFDAELLRDVIHVLRQPSNRINRSKFHFKLASEEDSYRISGFKHNAISPYGLLIDIPFVICSRILETAPDIFYMGGGRVDVKLAVPTKDFIRSKNPIIGRISKIEVEEDS
jgi:hypothetical protein